MKKLSKELIAQRDSLQERFGGCTTELEQAVEAYNSAIEALWEPVQTAMDAYNELVSDANSWRNDCAQEIQDYMDERSEKWLESDKGQDYEAWRQEFADVEFDAVEFEKPEELNLDLEDMVEVLGNLNESMGE